jgi:hypothetical protein
MLTTRHPLSAKDGTNFGDKQRLLADSGHRVLFSIGSVLYCNDSAVADPTDLIYFFFNPEDKIWLLGPW